MHFSLKLNCKSEEKLRELVLKAKIIEPELKIAWISNMKMKLFKISTISVVYLLNNVRFDCHRKRNIII